MEIDVRNWLDELSVKLKARFKDRLEFIGLQGSFRRGEGGPESDIDAVVILDELGAADLKAYRSIIRSMPLSERACGFICAKRELINWFGPDLFQLLHDTEPLYGSIDYVLGMIGELDATGAVRMGASNLYHAACHCYVFGDGRGRLPSLLKQAFFILQAVVYLKDGVYVSDKAKMAVHLSGLDAEVLRTVATKDAAVDKDEDEVMRNYDMLIRWCGALLERYAV